MMPTKRHFENDMYYCKACHAGVEESEEGTLADIYNTHMNKYPTLLVYCKFLVGCPCNC